jgi:hypothetical protein
MNGFFAMVWRRYYRQIIYALLFGVILAATFYTGKITLRVSDMTLGVFNAIAAVPRQRAARINALATALRELKARHAASNEIAAARAALARARMHSNGVVLIAFDFSPDVSPELTPMAEAVLRHAFARDVRVLGIVAATAQGAPLAKTILDTCAQQSHGLYPERISGEHFVYLGNRPDMFSTLMQMGKDIHATYETDYGGRTLATLPFMRSVKTFKDIDYIVVLTGYVGVPETWMQIANTKYGARLGMGMTAVSIAGYMPYLHSKQITGLIPGLRGAAEYEIALGKPHVATRRMVAQLFAHVLVVFFIIVGNIEYFVRRRYGA